MIKYNIKEVKKMFSERGYELLSERCNRQEKLQYICPTHRDRGVLTITIGKFAEGNGCRHCAYDLKRLTFEEVENRFLEKGFVLIDKEYVGQDKLMRCICPNHPDEIMSIKVANLTKWRGCKICSKPLTFDFEDIRVEFCERGYLLLEDRYIDSKSKLKYICSMHSETTQEVGYSKFRMGQGCKYCGLIKRGKSHRVPFSKVKSLFEKRGYILLETEYHNALANMKYVCPTHPDRDNQISYCNLLAEKGCPQCATDNFKGENNPNWKGGTTLISIYLRSKISEWKTDSFKKYNYKCFVTGKKGNLQIHHITPFHKIRDKCISKLGLDLNKNVGDYSEEELDLLVNEFTNEHKKELGIPLLKAIHDEFHCIYGKGDNVTFENLIEFKNNYINKYNN
jgi:hypothetical protein